MCVLKYYRKPTWDPSIEVTSSRRSETIPSENPSPKIGRPNSYQSGSCPAPSGAAIDRCHKGREEGRGGGGIGPLNWDPRPAKMAGKRPEIKGQKRRE